MLENLVEDRAYNLRDFLPTIFAHRLSERLSERKSLSCDRTIINTLAKYYTHRRHNYDQLVCLPSSDEQISYL